MSGAPRRARWGWACAVLIAASAGWGGCGRPRADVTLVSYGDHSAPQTYQLTLDQCVYHADAGGNLHLVARGRSSHNPGDAATHYLHVRMFWKPHPGRTPADSSGINATLRYMVATADGAAEHAGTGFVYPKKPRSRKLQARIESATLRLEWLSGTLPELPGDARLTGRLRARENAHAAVELLREMELRLPAPPQR